MRGTRGAFIAVAGRAVFSAGFAVHVTGIGRYRVHGWLTGSLMITLRLFLSNLLLVLFPRRERLRLAREAAERAETERRARLDPLRGTPALGRTPPRDEAPTEPR